MDSKWQGLKSRGRSKSTSSAPKSWPSTGPTCLDTPTFETSTGQQLSLSSCCAEDSPANLSVAPGSEEAQKMTVGSGLKCLELSTGSSPLGAFLRTCLASTQWASSTHALMIWKPRATKQGRLKYRLVPLVPRTDGTDCGLLPTPTANDDNKSPEAHMAMKQRMKGGPRNTITSLQVMAKAGLLPTPHSNCHTGAGEHGEGGDNLQTVVQQLPTPTANRRTGLQSHGVNYCEGGPLNPEFVSWMMGFPAGWTNIQSQPDEGCQTE